MPMDVSSTSNPGANLHGPRLLNILLERGVIDLWFLLGNFPPANIGPQNGEGRDAAVAESFAFAPGRTSRATTGLRCSCKTEGRFSQITLSVFRYAVPFAFEVRFRPCPSQRCAVLCQLCQ